MSGATAPEPAMSGAMARESRCAALLRHVLLAAVAVFTLLPLIVMLLASFETPAAIYGAGAVQGAFAGFDNYLAAVTEIPIARYLGNGVAVVLLILLAQLCVCLPAAYALATHELGGRRAALTTVVLALAVPPQALFIPVFLLVSALGWIDRYWALVLPVAASPFGLLMFYRAFRAVPVSLVHAARLEGLSEPAILLKVMIPLARPSIAAFALFSVMVHWNDYMWPYIVLSSPDKLTPALGIVYFNTYDAGTNYGPLMAAAVIIVAPLVVLFLCMQDSVFKGYSHAVLGK